MNSVNSIMQSKTFDNGMICATEQNVIVLDGVYDAVKAEFQKRGAFFLQGDDIDKVGNTVIVNGAVNAKMVGQPATKIAAAAGVEVPAWTKVLIGETESVEPSNPGRTRSSRPSSACTARVTSTTRSPRRPASSRTVATATPPRYSSTRARPRRSRSTRTP